MSLFNGLRGIFGEDFFLAALSPEACGAMRGSAVSGFWSAGMSWRPRLTLIPIFRNQLLLRPGVGGKLASRKTSRHFEDEA